MPDITTPRKRPTRNDVAERAQVSSAVVSYVMTGAKHVTPETAKRVRTAMEELGYRPNSTARALRTGRTHTLALIVADVSNPFFSEYALQLEIAATERGYALLIANSHESLETEVRLLDEIAQRGVDGVMLSSVRHASDRSSLDAIPVPVMWIDAFHPAEGAASVGVDIRHSARTVVRHLAEVHGCRSVGLVIGASSQQTTDPRVLGWAEAIEEIGLEPGPVVTTTWTREGGIEAARMLLDTPNRPDAVFAGSDLLGIGVLRGAADLGLRVPEDLRIISYDGTAESAFSVPRLTSFKQPVREMARAAIDTIIDFTPDKAHHTLFRGELLLRESCGCAPAAP